MNKYKNNVMKWNLEKYNSSPVFYQKFQILLLMENANTHLVSLFKDYLLLDDITEFFKDYYKRREIYERLKTILNYYESSSYIFPNYTAINEGKYIYRNIIKKQQLIDYLEYLEDKKKEKDEKRARKNKNFNFNLNILENEQNNSSCFDVFNSKVYNSIIKETGNDSKINELFCIVKNNNESEDSLASILKLSEEIKEYKKKEIRQNKEFKEKDIKKSKEFKEKEKIIENKNNNINNKNYTNINLYNINKKIKNKIESKIFILRKGGNKQNKNNNNSKKVLKKIKLNLNINNILNNNSNLITKNYNYNYSNRNHIINNDTSKSNDNFKNNPSNSSHSNNKNNYKKNNIIINIINNNKTNNYQSNINYYSNYTSNNQTENIQSDIKNNINSTDNSKYYSINRKMYNSNNKIKINTTIKDQSELKKLITKYSVNNQKTISKKKKTNTKSKILSLGLKTDINLTDRTKNGKSLSNLIRSGKDQSKIKTKIFISPRYNKQKRTKTDILGNQTDIFILGQQNEINSCHGNKSINRQILKSINLTNTHKLHKNTYLINKKVINNKFDINKKKADNKFIMHISTNSQNLTGIKISKVSPLALKEIMKKKIGVFSFNFTERTSRNHSKKQIKNNTMAKKNYLDSFSPKISQDIIYKKMKKKDNKKSAIINSFIKNVGSNKKIKDLIRKNNNSINNSKRICTIINNNEVFNKSVKC